MKKTIYLISIVFLSNSCNYQENIREKNTYEITSLIIENTGGPIKPPPPPNGQKSRFTKNQIDSIMMRIQKVALFPVFYKVKRDFSKNAKIEDEYNKLVSDFGTIEKEEKNEVYVFVYSFLTHAKTQPNYIVNIDCIVDGTHNINFFMNVPVTADGGLSFADGISDSGKYVELLAKMDVIVLLSNCPQLNNPCNAYNPTPVEMIVWS